MGISNELALGELGEKTISEDILLTPNNSVPLMNNVSPKLTSVGVRRVIIGNGGQTEMQVAGGHVIPNEPPAVHTVPTIVVMQTAP